MAQAGPVFRLPTGVGGGSLDFLSKMRPRRFPGAGQVKSN
jgi:hypothetical protein